MSRTKVLVLVTSLVAVMLHGCASDTGTNALIGGAAGGGAGLLLGGTQGAIAGGLLGGAAGAIIGELDDDDHRGKGHRKH